MGEFAAELSTNVKKFGGKLSGHCRMDSSNALVDYFQLVTNEGTATRLTRIESGSKGIQLTLGQFTDSDRELHSDSAIL